MDTMLIPIVVAAAVGLAVWGFIALTSDPDRKEKKKLTERLAMEPKTDAAAALQRSITLQMQATGLPMGLASNPLMQNLHRRVVQAYPEGSLKTFLIVLIGSALVCGFISGAIFAKVIFVLIGLVVGGYIPFFVLSSKRNRRQKQMTM